MSEARRRGGAPIEFWFDFASGHAYFAALEIEALAERHARTVLWRPVTLGAAFEITGVQG
jgi:2-hydroxychromene-2-carboxylate isomerase